MKSKTILGADGATKMRQITVGIHGKGGETGIKAIMLLTALINDLKQCKTRRKYTTDIYKLRGTANAALIVILLKKKTQMS